MPTNYVPVSREHHGLRRWRRYDNYAFAREIHIIDIALAETAKVASSMPIVFVGPPEAPEPRALMALEPGNNSFIGSDSQWNGAYVPASLRGHPFKFLSTGQELVLCIDEASTADESGEVFFDDAGTLSPAIHSVVSFLQQIEISRQAAKLAAAALARLGVIRPIPPVAVPGLAPHHAAALFGVDAQAFSALSDHDFASLRATDAIQLAYHQMLSLEQWPALLAHTKRKRDHAAALSARAAAIYQPSDDGELQIDWNRFKT